MKRREISIVNSVVYLVYGDFRVAGEERGGRKVGNRRVDCV